MSKDSMRLALGNALILLDAVETKGEKNLNALLAAIQQVRRVYEQMKEGNQSENHDEQRKDT